VLLIGVETLRADHLGCLGYHRNTTPALDRLASEGALFTKAFATSSWTMPTMVSVLTSLYPGMHEAIHWEKKRATGARTCAEILREHGYATVAVVSNPALESDHGFDTGFDLYDDFSFRLNVRGDLFGDNDDITRSIYNGAVTNETVNKVAVGWLEKNYKKRFLMFLFYFDAHHDYVPPAPFDQVFDSNYDGSINGRSIRHDLRKGPRPSDRDLEHIMALYDGELLYTDECILRLLDKYKEFGILDDTLVVVVGDHGDEFFEHGGTSHAFTLYNEVIRVPLIFRWPAAIPAGGRIDALVSQVDIMPTILDYLGIKYEGVVQGVSLRPLIEQKSEKLHDIVYAEVSVEEHRVFSAAITERYKLILDMETGHTQLFDWCADPSEQNDIYGKQAPVASISLKQKLIAWLSNNARALASQPGEQQSDRVDLHNAKINQLRALGYLQ
jgi:arylsulfatase A-like enzyme